MKYLCFVITVILIKCLEINSQGNSPCPDIFTFVNEGNNVYGQIRVSLPDNGLSSIETKVNFTIAALVPNSNYAGKLQLIQNGRTSDGQYVMVYRVHFPIKSPLPRLTSLTVNNNGVCYGSGDVSGPGQYVTTIGLQHSYFRGSSDNIIYNTRPSRPSINQDQSPMDLFNSIVNKFKNQDNPVTEYTQVYEDATGKIKKLFFSYNSQQDGFEGNPFNFNPQEFTRRPMVQPPPPPPTTTTTTRRPRPRPRPTPAPTEASKPASSGIACGVVAGGNDRVALVYNGLEYPRGDLPWLVAIYKKNSAGLVFVCAGTLISSRHVVTAGHCVQQKSSLTYKKDIVVKVGVFDLDDWSDDSIEIRRLESVHIHEQYNSTFYINDISVFTLDKAVEYNNIIRPACLWKGNSDLQRIVGDSGVVAGWGKSERGDSGHSTPRMVRIPIVSTSDCKASRQEFHSLTSSTTLCAGDRNGAGPCSGDSGGGLYILQNGQWMLRGVVSFSLRSETGDSVCNLNEYIVFTDTAKYMDWISRIVRST